MNFSLEEQKIIVQAGRYSLADFSIITNSKYKPTWLHEEVENKLEAVEKGEIKRLMLFLPPRHGKSQLASINFPAWYLGRNPDKEIITASYSGDLAQDFGSKTRELIGGDTNYRYIFPGITLKEDEKAKAKWRTNKGGSYTSVGVGGGATGKGAHCLIIDDPIKNQEEANSETYRNKVWNWYISTAYTRLEKNGAIIIILTRWHLDDLAGRLLKAQAEGGERWEDVKILNTRNFLTIDTAISEKASSDSTGIVKNYVDNENKWNLKAERSRVNPKELIDKLFYWQNQDNFEKIGIEKTIYLQAIKPFLDEEMRKRDKFLPIYKLEHQQTAKETRIRGLIPRYESKSIYHIEGECEALEDELLSFPKGMNDDVIDACAYQTQIAEAPMSRKNLINILQSRDQKRKEQSEFL